MKKIKILKFEGEQGSPSFGLLVVLTDKGWKAKKLLWGYSPYKIGQLIPKDDIDGKFYKLRQPSAYRKFLLKNVKSANKALQRFETTMSRLYKSH